MKLLGSMENFFLINQQKMIYDKTYDNIQKIMIGKGDVCITG